MRRPLALFLSPPPRSRSPRATISRRWPPTGRGRSRTRSRRLTSPTWRPTSQMTWRPGKVDVGPEVVIVGNGSPCEVQRILVDNCQSCHGTTPTEDSPMSLVTWADMHQPTRLQPEVDVGTRSIARMQSTTNPMPPLPAAPLAAGRHRRVGGVGASWHAARRLRRRARRHVHRPDRVHHEPALDAWRRRLELDAPGARLHRLPRGRRRRPTLLRGGHGLRDRARAQRLLRRAARDRRQGRGRRRQRPRLFARHERSRQLLPRAPRLHPVRVSPTPHASSIPTATCARWPRRRPTATATPATPRAARKTPRAASPRRAESVSEISGGRRCPRRWCAGPRGRRRCRACLRPGRGSCGAGWAPSCC